MKNKYFSLSIPVAFFILAIGSHGSITSGPISTANNISREQFDAEWESQYQTIGLFDAKIAAQNLKKISPTPLYLGLSSSHYQYEGGIDQECSCHRFFEYVGKCLPGDALDFWNNYEQIVDEVAATGSSMLRLSISWERIQPTGPASWNQEAAQHYRKIIGYIKSKGIEPLVVFHHYTVPTWFEDLDGTFLGGFVSEKNIHHYVSFATRMHAELGDLVQFWSTYNFAYDFKAYKFNHIAPGNFYYVAQMMQQFQGGKPSTLEEAVTCYVNAEMQALFPAFYDAVKELHAQDSLRIVHLVKKHILQAHVAIYRAIHVQHNILSANNPAFLTPQVGLQVGIQPIYPEDASSGPIDDLMQNDNGFYRFFAKGIYNITDTDLDSTWECLDWIGINSYERSILKNNGELGKETEPHRLTAGDKTYCPQIIAFAVREVSDQLVQPIKQKTGKTLPIIITENGLTAKDADQRNSFFRAIFYTIGQLVKEGHSIVGYLAWSSHDCFEWGNPYEFRKYGLHEVTGFNTSGQIIRQLNHPDNNYFVQFCQEFKKLN